MIIHDYSMIMRMNVNNGVNHNLIVITVMVMIMMMVAVHFLKGTRVVQPGVSCVWCMAAWTGLIILGLKHL